MLIKAFGFFALVLTASACLAQHGNQGRPDKASEANCDSAVSFLAETPRAIISMPRLDSLPKHRGKCIVEVRINSNGQVISCRAGVKGTTVSLSEAELAYLERLTIRMRFEKNTQQSDTGYGRVIFCLKP